MQFVIVGGVWLIVANAQFPGDKQDKQCGLIPGSVATHPSATRASLLYAKACRPVGIMMYMYVEDVNVQCILLWAIPSLSSGLNRKIVALAFTYPPN